MATMDIIKHYGGAPANFLDIGGGANEAMVAAALKIIISDPNVKTILINIFGGITRGDLVAKGILAALEDVKTDLPIIIRLVGMNAKEGRAIIAGADLLTATTLAEAAQKSVAASKEVSR
jgi:succinyl-CoA synthetase beta subunit